MFFYDSPLAARLFDLQHEGDPILEAECDLFLDAVRRSAGPALDMGCGTGRILLPALQEGADICGFDVSVSFLSRLRTKAQDLGRAPAVWRATLCSPAVGRGAFDLAFAAFRTFDHLIESGSRTRFLQETRSLLRPGGRLLLNLANPDPLELQNAQGQKILMRDDLLDPDSGRRVIWWGATRFDCETRRILQIYQYDFVDEGGRVREIYDLRLVMRWTPFDEMEAMADAAGYAVAGRWGGFEGERFEVGTGDAVWDLRPR